MGSVPEKQEKCRRPTAFKPGQSGNPKGRPKKEKCFSDIARQMLSAKKMDITYLFPKDGKEVTAHVSIISDKTIYHGMCAALVREALGGNVQAAKELIDRTEGRAREFIDHTTNGESVSFAEQYTDEEKAAIALALRSIHGGENAASEQS